MNNKILMFVFSVVGIIILWRLIKNIWIMIVMIVDHIVRRIRIKKLEKQLKELYKSFTS